MPKRIHGLYMIEDKDVFDLLTSTKVSMDRLRLLARGRGLLLSKEDSRDDVIARISRLPYGLRQVKELLDCISTPQRRDDQTVCKVVTRCDATDLRKCLDDLISDRTSTQQEVYSAPKQIGKNTVSITASFPEVDPGKSRLAQRVIRDVEIQVEQTRSGLTIRCTDQSRARLIVKELIERLNKVSPCEQITIDLSGVHDAELRTKFFLDVMSRVPGYICDNVINIRASRLPSSGGKNDDEETSSARRNFEASVRKVVLTGQRLDKSPYYRQLEGFFISQASWIARNDKKGLLAEFEIGFGDDENASNFFYSVQRVFEMSSRGEYSPRGTRPTGDRLKDLTQALETAVLAASESIQATAAGARVGKRAAKKSTTKVARGSTRRR